MKRKAMHRIKFLKIFFINTFLLFDTHKGEKM